MVKTFLLLCVFTVFSIYIPDSIKAQVVINEFSSSSSTDWVELYAFDDVNISGWYLDDYDTESKLKVFPDGTLIGPSSNSLLVIDVGTRLNKNGDEISLFNNTNTPIDKINYGDRGGVCIPFETESIGRYPDANSTIDRFKVSSKGQSNNSSELNPCPTPTAAAISTNTPSPKPTNSPNPKPTNSPVPTSPKLKPTTLETDLATVNTNDKSQVLGVIEEDRRPTPVSEVGINNQNLREFPNAAIALVISGMGIIIYATILFIKKRH